MSLNLAVAALVVVVATSFVEPLLLFCPSPCKYNNQTFCGHIPCPLPPCDDPLVLTPGDCCEHCPTDAHHARARVIVGGDTGDCPYPCTQGGVKYCHPIPCPHPPCDNPVTTKGECCPHCPNARAIVPASGVPADCPYPCTQGGVKYCHPLPCPLPPCVDPVTTMGECCPHCPNGPNCQVSDVVIAQGQTATVPGGECTCKYGGLHGLITCV